MSKRVGKMSDAIRNRNKSSKKRRKEVRLMEREGFVRIIPWERRIVLDKLGVPMRLARASGLQEYEPTWSASFNAYTLGGEALFEVTIKYGLSSEENAKALESLAALFTGAPRRDAVAALVGFKFDTSAMYSSPYREHDLLEFAEKMLLTNQSNSLDDGVYVVGKIGRP